MALREGADGPPSLWALAVFPARRFFASLFRRGHGGGLGGFIQAVNDGALELAVMAKIYERWRAYPERAIRESRGAATP